MQPQGLEALLPPGQAMPQMNNPRLAAAMDVVTSDAEEQILDPRTLAMLKYKDALQAMQAADQMMAAAQPQPMPPTVAERTKLAAEQGIAGLAQRLAPGVQQQGRQVAAQQAQQAMQGGGLPQLPAPNMAGMAGMAGGGIVGYAEGGAPTPTKAVQRPVAMGQPNVEAQAAMADGVASYVYNYKNLRASMEAAKDPQQKAEIAQMLREMQQTYDPDIVAEAHMKMSGQGMAGGGEVRGFAEGKEVKAADSTIGRNNPYNLRETGQDWQGQTGETRGFTDFDSPYAGTRAADRVLQTYGKSDISTIDEIVSRYAPSNENDTQGYIKFVSEQTGIPSSQPIDLGDPVTRSKILAAIGKMESGQTSTPEEIRAMIAAADRGGQGGGSPREQIMVPTPGYGAGDRTGQGSTLAGMGQGLASLISDAAGGAKQFVTDAMSAPLQFLSGEMRYPRQSIPTKTPEDPELEAMLAEQMARIDAGPSASSSTTPAAPATPAPDAVETLLRQPSPREMGPNAAPEQYFRSQFRPDGGEAARAAPAGAEISSDDRMRRLIAGLRGLGAQGLGGYAAGSAEEKLRMEQELIAEQERQSRAAAEEREFGQKDREIEAMDNLRTAEATARREDQAAALQFRYDQLNDAQRNELKAAYLADMRVGQANAKIAQAQAAIEEGPGWFGGASEHTAEQMAIIAKAQETLANILGEYMSQYQEVGPQSAPTATTIDPATQAALEQYSAQ